MKNNLESIFFAASLFLFGLLFTPISHSIEIGVYGLVVAASILLGISLSIRQRSTTQERIKIIDALSKMSEQQRKKFEETYKSENTALAVRITDDIKEQQKVTLELSEKVQQQLGNVIDIQSVSQAKLVELFSFINESNQTLQLTITESTAKRKEDLKENMTLLIDQFDMMKEMRMSQFKKLQEELAGLNHQIVHTLISTVEKGNGEVNDLQAQKIKEIIRLSDALQDLEGKVTKQGEQVLDALDSSNEIQEDIFEKIETTVKSVQKQHTASINLMESYQKKVDSATSEINEIRNSLEEDIRSLIEQLANAVDQLTDSKHEERQRVMEVQKKLASQFERLAQRG